MSAPSGAAPALGLVRWWALVMALSVALGGLWPALAAWGAAEGGAELPRLSAVLGWQLALLVGPLPLLWAALGSDPAPGERLAARGLELALLVAVTLPALALGAPFTSLAAPQAAAALLHAALLLLVTGAWLALPDGEAGARPTRVLLLGLAAGSPLLALVLRDLLGARPAALPLLTAPLASDALVASAPRAALGLELALALPGALLLPGAALLWAALRRRAGRPARAPALAAALAAAALLGPAARAEPRVRRVEPALPEVLRDDAGWPLWVELEGGGPPVELAARGLGLRVVVPARPGERTLVPGIAIGGVRRLTLEGRDGPGEAWTALPGGPAPARVARPNEVVVGVLGDRARTLAAAIVGARRAHVVRLLPRDVAALPQAGDALDLLVVARGALPDPASRAAVVAFAAAGGVVALDGFDDLAALSDGAGQGATTREGWDVRPLGAGALVGPTDPLGMEVPDGARVETFLERRAGRARRAAFEEAALAVLAPGPDAALGRRAALAALAALGALLLLGPLVERARPHGPGVVAGGALVAGLLLALALPRAVAWAAFTEPTWGASAALLELPAGGRLAARHEVVALAAPRASPARVLLPGPLVERAAPPPRPVLAAPAQAEAELLVRVDDAGCALELRADRVTRAVARVEPFPLAGPVTVARGPGGALRVENRAGLDLRGLMAFVEAGVVPLGDLPPGGTLSLAALPAAEPFERWRLGSTPSGAELPSSLRRLAAAAVGGRSLSGGRLVLVATAPGRPRIASGVAGEQPLPTLVVVSAR